MSKNVWELRISQCDFVLVNTKGAQVVSIGISNKDSSKILDKGFVKLDKLPKKWCEVYGMSRFLGEVSTLREVKSFWGKILPVLFSLSDGNPIIWQCSERHARFYKLTFRREPKYKFSFIAGSLSGGKHIYDDKILTGENNNEQIVMLELIENIE